MPISQIQGLKWLWASMGNGWRRLDYGKHSPHLLSILHKNSSHGRWKEMRSCGWWWTADRPPADLELITPLLSSILYIYHCHHIHHLILKTLRVWSVRCFPPRLFCPIGFHRKLLSNITMCALVWDFLSEKSNCKEPQQIKQSAQNHQGTRLGKQLILLR